uniref:Uncharacterized protein n=1 Tax=Ascaris lumbricoides TaxID=6252 RepID=A0A0M3HZS3_ASCLU
MRAVGGRPGVGPCQRAGKVNSATFWRGPSKNACYADAQVRNMTAATPCKNLVRWLHAIKFYASSRIDYRSEGY